MRYYAADEYFRIGYISSALHLSRFWLLCASFSAQPTSPLAAATGERPGQLNHDAGISLSSPAL